MNASREYSQYKISRKRFVEILQFMLKASDDVLLPIANKADIYLGSYLVESIRYNVSFERMEAMHGVLAVSKSNFYSKRRLMFHLIDEEMKKNEIISSSDKG